MGQRLADLLPPVEKLLEIEPEELAGALLELLCQVDADRTESVQNFVTRSDVQEYAGKDHDRVVRCFAEAWSWLLSEGFLAEWPLGYSSGATFCFVTRRGRAVRDRAGLAAYRRAAILPRKALDPVLERDVRPLFDRGKYETAVFEAFKEVEVRVRDVAKLQPTDLGTALMRKALDPQTGPLADQSRIVAEREALAHFAAGAIGLFKNPTSHRRLPLTDAAEAAEMILIANHLLRIIAGRSSP